MALPLALLRSRIRYAVTLVVVLTATALCSAQSTPLQDAPEFHTRGGLPNVFAKWKTGQPVRVGYLGGSITEQNGWRPKTLAWFQARYPGSKTTEINAAIGGTGSDLGVFRLHQDVLVHHPDLLFVEFAVNDGSAPIDRIQKAMEGIVRQTWRANPSTDICFVYTLTEGMLWELDAGKYPRAAAAMEEVADHYGIPSIHMGVEVAKLHREGKLVFTGPVPTTDADRATLSGKMIFSPDGVHPYPESGHEIYLRCVERAFSQFESLGFSPAPHRLQKPLIKDNWEQAKLVTITPSMLSRGWQKLNPTIDTVAARFVARVPDLWKATQPGETITLKFRGTTLMIYDLVGPSSGEVSIQYDQQAPYTVNRFDPFCTFNRLATLPVANSVVNAVHTIQLKILAIQPDKLAILRTRKENAWITSVSDKMYDGPIWYAGSIMVIGDVISN